jgi:hypothetical protein
VVGAVRPPWQDLRAAQPPSSSQAFAASLLGASATTTLTLHRNLTLRCRARSVCRAAGPFLWTDPDAIARERVKLSLTRSVALANCEDCREPFSAIPLRHPSAFVNGYGGADGRRRPAGRPGWSSGPRALLRAAVACARPRHGRRSSRSERRRACRPGALRRRGTRSRRSPHPQEASQAAWSTSLL